MPSRVPTTESFLQGNRNFLFFSGSAPKLSDTNQRFDSSALGNIICVEIRLVLNSSILFHPQHPTQQNNLMERGSRATRLQSRLPLPFKEKEKQKHERPD